jgi:hypothetical protein
MKMNASDSVTVLDILGSPMSMRETSMTVTMASSSYSKSRSLAATWYPE